MREDSPWKDVVEHLFPQFMEFFFPHIARDIDFARGYRFLDKELQQISLSGESKKRLADKLVQVTLNNGEEKLLLIHLEVQGRREKDFARRMYVYNYRIFDRFNQDVVSMALFTDASPTYRPNHYRRVYWDFWCDFHFPIAKIVDYIHYDFSKTPNNLFSVGVQAYLKTRETEGNQEERYRWKKKFILKLYEFGYTPETLYWMYRFIVWIMKLPGKLEDQLFQEVFEIEKKKGKKMLTTVEKRWIKQGRKEGIKEGKIEGLIKAITAVLEVKYQEVPQELLQRLQKIDSPQKLDSLLEQAKMASSLQEFADKLNGNL